MQKEVEGHRRAQAGNLKKELINEIERPGGAGSAGMLIKEVPLDAGAIKDIAFQLKAEAAPLFAVLGSTVGDKPTLTCLITEDLAAERDLNAGQVIRDLARHIQGGGGGQPFFATAGGKKVEGMADALEAARAVFGG